MAEESHHTNSGAHHKRSGLSPVHPDILAVGLGIPSGKIAPFIHPEVVVECGPSARVGQHLTTLLIRLCPVEITPLRIRVYSPRKFTANLQTRMAPRPDFVVRDSE